MTRPSKKQTNAVDTTKNPNAALEESIKQQSQCEHLPFSPFFFFFIFFENSLCHSIGFSRMFAMLPETRAARADAETRSSASVISEEAIEEMRRRFKQEREKDKDIANHPTEEARQAVEAKMAANREQKRRERQKRLEERRKGAADADAGKKRPRAAEEAGEDGEAKSDVRFSSFDFSTGKAVPSYLVEPGKKRARGPSQNTRALLEKAVHDKQTKGEAAKWEAAERRMRGETVKDNTELLKKKLRAEKKQREKSAKKWEERNAAVEEQLKAKQERRRQNIREHSEAKKERMLPKELRRPKQLERHVPHSLAKRRKLAAAEGGKKPQKRPGFEGKKKLLN